MSVRHSEVVTVRIPQWLAEKKEIARYVLPQAVETELILTMNARELHDVFFPLRLSKRAQPEIRELAELML